MRTHANRLSKEERDLRIADYLSGMTLEEVAVKYGVKRCSVWEMLSRRGLVRPGTIANRRYTLNESAFGDPLTREAAYWIGFLMADGYVSPRENCSTTVGCNLASKDAMHLEKLAAFVGTNQPVEIRPFKRYEGSHKSGPQARFAIRSNRIAKSLEAYGVVPRKSLIAVAKKGIESSPDFWRGCIDGDGSIILKTHPNGSLCPYITLCGASLRLIEQFADFCYGVAPKCKATINRGRSTFSIWIGGKYAITVMRRLYSDGGPVLERKLSAVSQILEKAKSDESWCRDISEADENSITLEYAGGKTIKSISVRRRMCESTISEILHRHGVALRPRAAPIVSAEARAKGGAKRSKFRQVEEEIVSAYRDEITAQQVKDHFKVSNTQLYRILKKYGIKPVHRSAMPRNYRGMAELT